jgi:hypothetical protein
VFAAFVLYRSQAGEEGILTPELCRRLGVSPKVLFKALPELCKRFGVKVRSRTLRDSSSCAHMFKPVARSCACTAVLQFV